MGEPSLKIKHLYDLVDKGFYKKALPGGALEPLKPTKRETAVHRIVEITDTTGRGYFSQDFLELEIVFNEDTKDPEKAYVCRCIRLASTDPTKVFTAGEPSGRTLCFASSYALAMEKASKIKIEKSGK